jgi:hypothetical protein
MTPRTMEPTEGEQGTKPYHTRSLAGSPSKSPSSGLHKPTWRPSTKPNEHRRLSGHHAKREAADEAKHADDPKFDKKEGKKIVEKKADQLEDMKAAIKEEAGTKSSDEEARKAVKDTKSGKGFDSKASSKDAEDADSRRLHGYTVIPNPTTSPSTGIRKPTWKPSSKPNEDRRLSEKHTEYHAVTTKKSKKAANGARSPGSHEPTMTPRTMEPTEAAQPQKPYHDARMLAGTPSKSPSSGLHKPTWKPSSKPNERRGLSKEHRQLSEDR